MLTLLRQSRRHGEVNRRQLLQVGGAGLLGLSLPKILAAQETPSFRDARAKSVIFLFLFGGPSQLETFDMKPDAPADIRGPFRPIASRTPGLLIGEHLPKLAQVSDKFAVLKTMSHDYNDHSGGGHYIQTGHRWQIPIGGGFNVTPNDWPAMGSVTRYAAAGARRDAPDYVVLPNSLGRLQEYSIRLRRPGETAGWLGRNCDPLVTRIDKRDPKDNPYWRACTDDELKFQIEGLDDSTGVGPGRLATRGTLLDELNAELRLAEQHRVVDSYDRVRRQAFDLVTSERTRRAFDIRQEPAELRDRYGRHLFGQSTLVARRLIEAGTRFVTVHYDCPDGYSWDSHVHSDDVKSHLLPTFDQAMAALLTDLDERGLLSETLVVAVGEMGRTPKANARWGRNHWSTLFPAVLAGAGIRGGTVHGETDKDAGYALGNPTRPEDLSATLFDALGVDPKLRLPDSLGRPHALAEGGRVLTELFG